MIITSVNSIKNYQQKNQILKKNRHAHTPKNLSFGLNPESILKSGKELYSKPFFINAMRHQYNKYPGFNKYYCGIIAEIRSEYPELQKLDGIISKIHKKDWPEIFKSLFEKTEIKPENLFKNSILSGQEREILINAAKETKDIISKLPDWQQKFLKSPFKYMFNHPLELFRLSEKEEEFLTKAVNNTRGKISDITKQGQEFLESPLEIFKKS